MPQPQLEPVQGKNIEGLFVLYTFNFSGVFFLGSVRSKMNMKFTLGKSLQSMQEGPTNIVLNIRLSQTY